MARLKSMLLGLGLGAGLMYYLDPNLGRQRRSLVRDKFNGLKNKSDEAIETGVRDLRNRAQGVLADAMGMISNEQVVDQVLAERVRARFGILGRHTGAISVEVNNGIALLYGDVLRREEDRIIRGVMAVRGIKGIENKLNVHEEAGMIQSLQGEGMAHSNGDTKLWSPSTRLLAGAGGSALFLYGMARGGLIGRVVSLTGMGLAVRSATNLKMRGLLGMGDEKRMVRVVKTVHVAAPVEEVYALWNDFSRFPEFMSNIKEIHRHGEGRSHWIVEGPAGVPVEFEAVEKENIPNQVIAWETVPESYVRHTGEVRFKPMGDEGTQVHVRMYYNPPAGAAGHALASFFGKDPKSAMDQDLARFQQIFGGEIRQDKVNKRRRQNASSAASGSMEP